MGGPRDGRDAEVAQEPIGARACVRVEIDSPRVFFVWAGGSAGGEMCTLAEPRLSASCGFTDFVLA